MKSLNYCSIFIIATMLLTIREAAAQNVSSTNVGGWTLALSTATNYFVSGEDVKATFVVSNGTSRAGGLDFTLARSKQPGFGKIVITDLTTGSRRPFIERTRKFLSGWSDYWGGPYRPSEFETFNFDLKEDYLLDEPGVYSIGLTGRLESILASNMPVAFSMPPIVLQVVGNPSRNAHESTNQLFITDTSESTELLEMSRDQVDAALKSSDSRASAQDLEGNWGQPTEGFQLSIRMQKSVFTNGEPILATITLRNVSSQLLNYRRTWPDDTLASLLLEQNGLPVPQKPVEHRENAQKTGVWISPQGTQRKFVKDLSKLFVLSHGIYHVQAQREGIFTMDNTKTVAVSSGRTTFQILPAATDEPNSK